MKVNDGWAYLYRALDSRGHTLDFYLSPRRHTQAAWRLLRQILNNVKKWPIPRCINTDKAPTYRPVLALLKREGRCPPNPEHRQVKYRNNLIECDHGKLKRIIRATLGFKSMKTAYATIKGMEVMRALRKGQAESFYFGHPLGEGRLVSRVFEIEDFFIRDLGLPYPLFATVPYSMPLRFSSESDSVLMDMGKESYNCCDVLCSFIV